MHCCKGTITFIQIPYMRYHLTLLCSLFAVVGFSQVRDITPFLSPDEQVFDLQTDSQGMLYAIKKENYNGKAVLKYNGSWSEVIGYTDKPVNLYVLDDIMYLLTEKTYSSSYRRLERRTVNGWDSIPVASLGGHISDVLLVKGELVVKGKFKGPEGPYHLAKWVNGSWQSLPLPQDKLIAHMVASYYLTDHGVDANGVHYFHVRKGGDTIHNEILTWDGINWNKLGIDGKFSINNAAVAPGGKVYASRFTKDIPPGIFELSGNNGRIIECTAKGYDGGWLSMIAVNDANEVFTGGHTKKKKDYLVYKYSNGNWEEFAKIKQGPFDMLKYLNGNLYLKTADKRLIAINGAGKPVEKKNIPIATQPSYEERERELWRIYSEYSTTESSTWQRVDDAIEFFNGSYEDDEKTMSIARTGKQETDKLIKDLNTLKSKITVLELGGMHALSNAMTEFLDASLSYVYSWNTIFSCYIKEDNPCFEATKKQQDNILKRYQEKEAQLKRAAAEFRDRKKL